MDEPFSSEIMAREKTYPAERLLETISAILQYAAEKIQTLTFSFRSILSLLLKKKNPDALHLLSLSQMKVCY